jgi:hypothetical protein
MNTTNIAGGAAEGYKLDWYIPSKTLLLSLSGNYTLEDAQEVNQLISLRLDQSQSPVSILIDAAHMNRPLNFSNIRSTQTYMHHKQLGRIYVATEDRLVRLALIVIFNWSRAPLHVCEDLSEASSLLKRHLASSG